MSVQAKNTAPGKRYRPTRIGSFDARGRAWLTRSTFGWERKTGLRLWMNAEKLNSREVWMLSMLKDDGILMRKHMRKPGCKTTVSEWVAVPGDYRLREVAR
jgi:hypothetical protein